MAQKNANRVSGMGQKQSFFLFRLMALRCTHFTIHNYCQHMLGYLFYICFRTKYNFP